MFMCLAVTSDTSAAEQARKVKAMFMCLGYNLMTLLTLTKQVKVA